MIFLPLQKKTTPIRSPCCLSTTTCRPCGPISINHVARQMCRWLSRDLYLSPREHCHWCHVFTPQKMDILGSKTVWKHVCIIEVIRTCLVLDLVVWTEMVFFFLEFFWGIFKCCMSKTNARLTLLGWKCVAKVKGVLRRAFRVYMQHYATLPDVYLQKHV